MTTQEFDKIIYRNAIICVDFFATWCKPCEAMLPVLDQFQERINGRADIYKIDVDDRDMAEVIKRYDIATMPTLMFFRRGEVLWRESGSMDCEKLEAALLEVEKKLGIGEC
jgi:thiol-disulfide isomerase/thioredoxin|nr:thioredoxin family protein [uncultured Alistipes sp.]